MQINDANLLELLRVAHKKRKSAVLGFLSIIFCCK